MEYLKGNRSGILQWDWISDFRFTIEVPIAIGIRFNIDLSLWEVFLFYVTSICNSYHHLLLRSVHRSVFMASVVERSETPMNIGAHLYFNNSIQLL